MKSLIVMIANMIGKLCAGVFFFFKVEYPCLGKGVLNVNAVFLCFDPNNPVSHILSYPFPLLSFFYLLCYCSAQICMISCVFLNFHWMYVPRVSPVQDCLEKWIWKVFLCANNAVLRLTLYCDHVRMYMHSNDFIIGGFIWFGTVDRIAGKGGRVH